MNLNTHNAMKYSITNKQKGFTLVELLVSMLIGLFILSVAVTFLITSSRTLVNQGSEDLIQENARFAFEILSSNVRLMGLNESTDPNVLIQGTFNNTICDGNESCTQNSFDYVLNGQNIDSDSIAFDYVLDSGTTCTGNQITQETKVVTVFFVSDLDGDGIASFNCRSFESQLDPFTSNFTNFVEPPGFGASPIIDGIDSMQVQYGVDTNGDGSVEQYSSYGNVTVLQRPNIKAIKVGLLVNSGQAILENQATESSFVVAPQQIYQVLDGQNTFTDLVLRQVYSTTIFLPNRI